MISVKIKLTKDVLHVPVVGDVQFGNEGFVESKLSGFMEICKGYIKESKSETWFVGTGDYIDFMSPSNRLAYRASGIYSSSKRLISVGTTVPLVDELSRKLTPMKDRTVALCMGHHWCQFDFMNMGKDKRRAAFRYLPEKSPIPGDSDQYLGSILGAKVSENLGMALISFSFPGGAKYRVLAWHGEGGGTMIGYMLNKLNKLSAGWEEINAIVAGHTHRLLGGYDVKLRPSEDGKEILDRNIALVNSGSYLKAYMMDDQAYPEAKGLPALALGSPVLTVQPYKRNCKWDFHVEVSLHA